MRRRVLGVAIAVLIAGTVALTQGQSRIVN
jgi:hypothetical protein